MVSCRWLERHPYCVRSASGGPKSDGDLVRVRPRLGAAQAGGLADERTLRELVARPAGDRWLSRSSSGTTRSPAGAVISQVLAYAAAVHGTTADEFERRTVARQLAGRGLLDVVRESAQAEVADAEEFHATLHSALQKGLFRLVLVLDASPQELVKLVGYLESVTQGLVIDLITAACYEIAGRRVAIPQRVEPERPARVDAPATSESSGSSTSRTGELVTGAEGFRDRVASTSAEQRSVLDKLVGWADRIVGLGSGLEISTYYRKRAEVVLLPRLLPDRVGLVSLYCYADGKPAVQLWRSVFERKAPLSMALVAASAGLSEIGQGTMAATISDELMEALLSAYREAAGS